MITASRALRATSNRTALATHSDLVKVSTVKPADIRWRLSNAKFYESGRAFWDERAESLEDQALMPIQDPVEMNLDLATLTTRLENTPYYAQLFQDAFGTTEVTPDRVAKSIAQFERSMVSYQSAFDDILDEFGNPDLDQLNDDQLRGFQIFHSGEGLCATCHVSAAQIADQAQHWARRSRHRFGSGRW